jgi:uncharacterized protein
VLTIISPAQFKAVPWKNGSGVTHELAISLDGNMEHFDWRLSMAAVNQDGYFSDFSGYHRDLILLQGNGIELTHDEQQCDRLLSKLSHASFKGHCKTYGKLIEGPIADFNLITDPQTTSTKIELHTEQIEITLPSSKLSFIYAAGESLDIYWQGQTTSLASGHLMELRDIKHKALMISGKDFILIDLLLIKQTKHNQ